MTRALRRLLSLIAAASLVCPSPSFAANAVSGKASAAADAGASAGASATSKTPAAPKFVQASVLTAGTLGVAPSVPGAAPLAAAAAQAAVPAPAAPALLIERPAETPLAPASADAPKLPLSPAARRRAERLAAAGEGKTAVGASAGNLDALYDGAAPKAGTVEGPKASASRAFRRLARPDSAEQRAELRKLKLFLADGPMTAEGPIKPFRFHAHGGERRARSAGLEGFFYTRRELAREGVSTVRQLDDQFRYLDALLASAPSGAEGFRERIAAIASGPGTPAEKDARLDDALVQLLQPLRRDVMMKDQASEPARRTATYMVFARAYNRLRPGKNLFDSFDAAEFGRIKRETRSNEIWLLDIFEIGEVKRWGTGGGSSYSLRGYIAKEEYGGDEGLRRLIQRAHAAGMRVKVDFVPNHYSLDSEMIKKNPEGFLHILPPQHLTDEQIMASVPREQKGGRAPIYTLVATDAYPFPDGARRPARVLIHHPRTDWGDTMWIDMGQIDYSRPSARAWQTEQVKRLFSGFGVDSVRRDMAYEVLNVRYFDRWVKILETELHGIPAGWARDGHLAVLDGLKKRWAALNGAEFLEEAIAEMKKVRPDAVGIDEIYGHKDEISRAGSDAVYNKSEHGEGQPGLYDAMQSKNARAIREALKLAAFARWQRGGAALVNFIGTHDGGEGNPVDKFGRVFKAAALTALMLRPVLFFNGLEQGVGQREQLIGDLSKSTDLEKPIPMDIPVSIDWSKKNADHASFLGKVLKTADERQDLLDLGAMDVLKPTGEDTPLVAFTIASDRHGAPLLAVANWSEHDGSGVFKFEKPVLHGFGAFRPAAGRTYVLRDLLDLDEGGRPREYVREGADLLENGLYAKLGGGGGHLFEIHEASRKSALESSRAAPELAPAAADAPRSGPSEPASSPAPSADPRRAAWDGLVERLLGLALVPFFFLQGPQLWTNWQNLETGNLAAISILPWIGYSTGILANSNLWGMHVDFRNHWVAAVQGLGVLTSAAVLVQIAAAGFMPGAALAAMGLFVAASVGVNGLRWLGRLPDGSWNAWNALSKLLGLFALPFGFGVTFGLMSTAPGAVFAASAVLPALGAAAMVLERRGRLPKSVLPVWSQLGAWLGTLLFVFLPLPQIVNNFAQPENIGGIAVGTLLLSTLGNLFETTGAVSKKGQIWFVGTAWAVVVGGLGVLLSMMLAGSTAPVSLLGVSMSLPLFIALYAAAVGGYLAWMVRQVKTRHGEASYWDTLKFALRGH